MSDDLTEAALQQVRDTLQRMMDEGVQISLNPTHATFDISKISYDAQGRLHVEKIDRADFFLK